LAPPHHAGEDAFPVLQGEIGVAGWIDFEIGDLPFDAERIRKKRLEPGFDALGELGDA
jgi:hypothetical protein